MYTIKHIPGAAFPYQVSKDGEPIDEFLFKEDAKTYIDRHQYRVEFVSNDPLPYKVVDSDDFILANFQNKVAALDYIRVLRTC